MPWRGLHSVTSSPWRMNTTENSPPPVSAPSKYQMSTGRSDVAAGGAQRAGLLPEEQDHLRARIREVDEARARHLRVRLPAVLELVARGLRERIADLPEALHEAVALVRLREGEERLALGIRDQQRDLLEEAAVAVGHRGGIGVRDAERSGGAAGSRSLAAAVSWAGDSTVPPASSRRSMSTQLRRVTESVYGCRETVHKRSEWSYRRAAPGGAARGSTPSSS